MLTHRLYLFAFVLAIVTLQPAELFAQSKATNYAGTIGKLKVEMRLITEPIMETQNGETYQIGVRYSGYYSYVRQGWPIKLSGVYNALGVGRAVAHPLIELREETDGEWTGDLDGTFNRQGVYSGAWHSAGGKRNLRFTLYPKRGK